MGNSEAYYNNWFLGQTKLGVSSGSTDPIMYYSFDIGALVHVVVVSHTSPLTLCFNLSRLHFMFLMV